MIGVYFSGTGNTRYCVEKFIQGYDPAGETFSIEAENAVQKICAHSEMIVGYPVQFSNIPKILMDFIEGNPNIWKSKRIFIIATMGLFSGDGAGVLARLLTRHGAVIVGGLHLKMPDSIGDEKALKRTLEQNQALVLKAERKIEKAVQELKNNHPAQDGIGFVKHLAGLFGQRLYFSNKTKAYSDKLKIDKNKCIQCERCISICPMENISVEEGQVVPSGKCTMVLSMYQLLPHTSNYFVGEKSLRTVPC